MPKKLVQIARNPNQGSKTKYIRRRLKYPDDSGPNSARKRSASNESQDVRSKRPRSGLSSKNQALGGSAVGSTSGRKPSTSGSHHEKVGWLFP